jgi:membrane protease YdiL (CAAX protease family)
MSENEGENRDLELNPLPLAEKPSLAEDSASYGEELPPADAEPLLFQSFSRVGILPTRIPNFGHLAILAILASLSLLSAALLTRFALHIRLFGISTMEAAAADIRYTLGGQLAFYLITFAASLLIFPLLWNKSLLAGLQWNGATALRLRRQLFGAALACFGLAILNGILLPGPTDAPIDKIFRTPGAAWLLFAFGFTFAPFFEEFFFRGFLLPALCTAYDWNAERTTGAPLLPPDLNGHPRWSLPAMIVASVVTSIPFALMHAEQTAGALGPFVLLVAVSLVLCWTRLRTRSLAASVLVHASYNFLLFFVMLIGTDGFRHLEKM